MLSLSNTATRETPSPTSTHPCTATKPQHSQKENKAKNTLLPLREGFPGCSVVKNSPANAGDTRDLGSIPRYGRSPGEGNGNPVFLSEKFHGQRSQAGYSPWGHQESDMTEHTHTHEKTQEHECLVVVLSTALEGVLSCKSAQILFS